jgi:hypothetical protein
MLMTIVILTANRNVLEEKPKHMLGPEGFIERNSNWKINFCDNEMKDAFMKTNFAGSSILWAYSILNPNIGTSKVEIWRLAVLYLHGGMHPSLLLVWIILVSALQ